MGLNETPSGERVHIGFFGRRNAGKSSLVNAVTGDVYKRQVPIFKGCGNHRRSHGRTAGTCSDDNRDWYTGAAASAGR